MKAVVNHVRARPRPGPGAPSALASIPAVMPAVGGASRASGVYCPLDVPRDARIVIVDDDPTVLEILRLRLEEAGFNELFVLEDASRAMDLLYVVRPDLLLTDLHMPTMSGFDLLTKVRSDRRLGYLPVVMLTSDTDASTRLKALELGVTDFLDKPVDPSELVLRLRNNLVVKAYQDELAASRHQSDQLLLSILPEPVADRLKRGESVADYFPEATVLFADLVDFTRFASSTDAGAVVQTLNEVFGMFDQVMEERGLEKIKTIGDAYMLAGGVPNPRPDHAHAVVDAALAMLAVCERLRARSGANLQVRIGVHTGPVLAGVIGTSKFAYDLWGDTVNVASRMESQGVAGCVQISEAVQAIVSDRFHTERRGALDIKGKGVMTTWFVRGTRS